jgi:predicted O-methyltransferase YrrM
MALSMYETSNDGIFDLVFLDGAHTFIHDALSTSLLKILLRPSGVIIFDDLYWTIMKSPTVNPDVRPINAQLYTREQMETPNIDMVCKIFMDRDETFLRLKNTNNWRAIYKKIK